MNLDHPLLDPFEPQIRQFIQMAFGPPSRNLAQAGFKIGDEWHTEACHVFKRACLPCFRETQSALGSAVLNIETSISVLKAEIKAARSAGQKEAARSKSILQEVLEERQLLFRRLIDSMLWVLIWPDRWLIRRLRIEGGIRPLLPSEIKPLLETSVKEKQDPESFILICDLSTVCQHGDIVLARWTPESDSVSLTVAELKTGDVNRALHERLKLLKEADIPTEIAKIEREMGLRTGKQAARMARQQREMRNFNRILATDRGIDLSTGRRLKMSKTTISKDYRDELSTVMARGKAEGVNGVTVDRCLHLLAVSQEHPLFTKGPLALAIAFYKMRHGALEGADIKSGKKGLPEALQSQKLFSLMPVCMETSVALPPFLWYPQELMFDALMGRIKVFAQFDHDVFFEMVRDIFGMRMSFIVGKEAAEIEQKKFSGALVEYDDTRFVRSVDKNGKTKVYGAKFFSRVYTELVRPTDLAIMAHTLNEEEEPL